MLRKLLNKLKGLFSTPPPAPGKPRIGDKVGDVIIQTQSQLIKHTKFEVGESYRLGEAIVTVHANKESMLAAIEATDARREAKEAKLTERAIDLMMMTPEQLQELKINEWLEKGRGKHRLIRSTETWAKVKGLFRRNDYKEAAPAPSGANESYKEEVSKQFSAITGIKEEETVKIMSKVP